MGKHSAIFPKKLRKVRDNNKDVVEKRYRLLNEVTWH